MAKIGKTINNVIRGDTRTENLTFLQSDQKTPVVLSGGTVYFSVNTTSDPASDATAVISKSVAGGTVGTNDTFTNGTLGKQQITLTHTDTNIPAATYWYDAQFVDATGNYLSSYRGQFILQSDIERL